jgi:putative transposase
VKKSRYTDEQTAVALKQAELGTPVEEVRRKMGISEATFYNWRKKYGGLGPSELRRCGSSKRRTPSSSAWSRTYRSKR